MSMRPRLSNDRPFGSDIFVPVAQYRCALNNVEECCWTMASWRVQDMVVAPTSVHSNVPYEDGPRRLIFWPIAR